MLFVPGSRSYLSFAAKKGGILTQTVTGSKAAEVVGHILQVIGPSMGVRLLVPSYNRVPGVRVFNHSPRSTNSP